MGHSRVYRMLKAGDLRLHKNSIKPKLSHEHKLRRLNFILSQIILPTINTLSKFCLMYNVVHIDEKWFNMSRETQRFYLFTWEEEEPYRHFPFTETKLQIRRSSNRPIGTPKLKAITRVTRDVIREKLIAEVLPAIRSKWPTNGVRDIWIQQDNARPHILTTNHAFNEVATQDGFNIRLVCQPASSPDMNILDLSLFNSL
ncbi:uncharacterized protein LOC130802520 [Amaranthus tricolor]|uniref:uncharacterized protein LOC130802520 n=1 Tax=Amaranthus tricolor TaxID=29722 RepID=UPI0025851D0B|nr:uncharacterized protein LOC130802520 [Amaranthus tricolor]